MYKYICITNQHNMSSLLIKNSSFEAPICSINLVKIFKYPNLLPSVNPCFLQIFDSIS